MPNELSLEEALKKGYRYVCDWCGKLYVERPFMCDVCRSNCFLHEVGAKCLRLASME